MQYLLPCGACGEKHAIEPRQAGRKISCGCGAVLEVPSLRGIRELAHTEPTKKRRVGPAWSPARGIVFVVGMLVAVIGLLVAGYALLVWRNLDTSEPLPEDLAAVYAAIDQKTPEEVLLLWQEEVRNRGIGTYHVPTYVVVRGMARFFGMLAIGGACLAVIGVAASASSILLRKT